jgi:hypothetical protein
VSDTLTNGEEPADPNENPNLKLLREKAKTADEATAALAIAQREIAVLKSPIDAESPLGKFFLQSYTGDITDTDALLAAANEIGVPMKGAAVTKPEGEVETPPEPNGTEDRQELAAGAPADTSVSPDPNKVAKDTFDAAIAAGKTEEAARGEMLQVIAQAGLAGDPRVLVE